MLVEADTMARVKGSKVTLTGHREDELKTQLETYYDHSATAEKLLNAASAKTVQISNTTGKPRNEGGKVLLFWSEQKKDGLHQYGIKELAESCLFELKNLLNQPRFTQAGKGKPIPIYGLARAKVEAESTLTIVKILQELKSAPRLNYTPSAWGERQIEKLGGRTGDVAAEHIASTPHDSSQTNQFRLPSKYLYAYEKMLRIKASDLRRTILNIVQITSPPPKSKTFSRNWTQPKIKTLFNTTFPRYGVSAGQLFIWLIYAIRGIENMQGWKVAWKGGLKTSDYTNFADAVMNVNVVPKILPNVRRVEEMRKGLMEAIMQGVV
jgi:hypothetical protein